MFFLSRAAGLQVFSVLRFTVTLAKVPPWRYKLRESSAFGLRPLFSGFHISQVAQISSINTCVFIDLFRWFLFAEVEENHIPLRSST